jgi:predicted nucleic acid-binding protein
MAEVILDANILVALLYDADVHHGRARALDTGFRIGGPRFPTMS